MGGSKAIELGGGEGFELRDSESLRMKVRHQLSHHLENKEKFR